MNRRGIKLRADALNPCKRPERATVRRTGPCFTISERGLKVLFRKGSEALACAVRATWA